VFILLLSVVNSQRRSWQLVRFKCRP